MISLPNSLLDILRTFIDMGFIFILIYVSYKFLKNTRAIPVIVGLLILMLISAIAKKTNMATLVWAFESLSGYFIIAFLVALQPEIRKVLYRLGEVGWVPTFFRAHSMNVDEIIDAISQMKEDKTGALIVFTNSISLAQHIEGGVELHARISKELLLSIFYGENPLHDGAVIIQNNRILLAATYLPMSNSSQLKRTHGARHRAGLGISEETDSFVIIVSEQRRKVSVAFLGILLENIDFIELKNILTIFSNGTLKEKWTDLSSKRLEGKNL